MIYVDREYLTFSGLATIEIDRISTKNAKFISIP